MKVFKPGDIKHIDNLCVDKYQIPTLILMEHAGIKISEEIQKKFNKESKVLIMAGKGNNGGDGLVVARLLYNLGYKVKVLYLGNYKTGDSKINFDILNSLDVYKTNSIADLGELLLWSEVVVDAIFGVGFRGNLVQEYIDIFSMINNSKRYVISVDVPSGLGSSNYTFNNIVVKANKTVTLGCLKENLLLPTGRENSGELVVSDIGLPKDLMEQFEVSTFLITPNMAKELLPKRVENSHKGTYGTGLIVGGSLGMSGAVILAAQAALKSGIGLLYTLVSEKLVDVIENNCIESITIPMPKGLIELDKYLKNTKSVAIGPGLSTENNEVLFLYFVENYKGSMVIDGDGLNLLANLKLHDLICENHVLTPHPKEMSRLTGLTVEEITSDPITVAREFSVKHNCTLVLKGSTTCIATKDGDVYLNTTGNNGLATGGSGDVLAGLIMSFMAQGLSQDEAAILGVYLHGLTADIISEGKGYYSLLPSDIPKELHKGFKKIQKG
ncbi:NAD(P)H-hydrate dehydratase [Alkalicella caledoniensis]|uniref:Bifunctional NAD(P)H-hydrate repair enzyme n=1 Tax=Alkalicella caledoniensis TaxID=2731377 RepID=A0A7G9W7B3_ALKCA|nr:NAD(P)H-hydrate dehydratase [Alkalicella caledoniensis]QNO14575.1 NAD(P)H-hydrate dehydratase [Alkalicella caledoniensis]